MWQYIIYIYIYIYGVSLSLSSDPHTHKYLPPPPISYTYIETHNNTHTHTQHTHTTYTHNLSHCLSAHIHSHVSPPSHTHTHMVVADTGKYTVAPALTARLTRCLTTAAALSRLGLLPGRNSHQSLLLLHLLGVDRTEGMCVGDTVAEFTPLCALLAAYTCVCCVCVCVYVCVVHICSIYMSVCVHTNIPPPPIYIHMW